MTGGHVEGTVLVGGKGYQALENPMQTLVQFKDKTIGTPRLGSIHDVILRKLISDAGLSKYIAIRNFEWADFILDAMLDGEIDGLCGTPPLAVLAMHQMEAKIILPPSMMWPYNPSYGILATENMIQNSPSTLKSFLVLHEDACNLIREHPKEAAGLVHKGLEIIDEDFAQEVFRISPKYCASLPEEYIYSTMAFVPTLREMGYLSKELRKEEIFNTKVLEKIHPGKHHYDDSGKL